MLEVTVVNSKHLYALLHPEQSNSRLYLYALLHKEQSNSRLYLYALLDAEQVNSRLHKQFRENLVYEMVQLHLDEKANPVPTVNPNENHLIGKHYAESKYPQRKTCTSYRYKKDAKGQQSRKKLAPFAGNVIDLFVKIVFDNTIPRAISLKCLWAHLAQTYCFCSTLVWCLSTVDQTYWNILGRNFQ